jgi:hypothetical protein
MRTRLAGSVLALTALLAGTSQALPAARRVALPALALPAPAMPPDTPEEKGALLRDAAQIARTTELPLALVQQEVLVQDAVGQLQARAAERWPATFGGLWIEQRTGLVRVAFTADAAANVAALAGDFVRPALLRPVTVQRSYRALKALQDVMVADREAFADGRLAAWPGLTGTRYGLDVDVRENRPVVVTDGHTPATVAALKAAYGDLRVDATGNGAEHACTKFDCRYFLRSGLGVDRGVPNCTSAFTVSSGQVNLETMTAGHCDGGVGYHGGSAYSGGSRYQNSGNVDASVSKVTGSFKAGPWMFVTPGEPVRKVTSVQSYAALAVGQWICKTGITTDYTCGSVLSRDYSAPASWPTPAHTNFILTDMCDKPGDSGAGIYIGGQAVGIISAGNSDFCTAPYRGWHGHIENAASALGLVVVTSDSAPFMSTVSATGNIGTSGTITVKFSKPVSCLTVGNVDFTVKVQGQLDWPVASTSCTQDSNMTVTLTVARPMITKTSFTVSIGSGTIKDPGGQGVSAGSRTATVV